jgi:hypothetical protein
LCDLAKSIISEALLTTVLRDASPLVIGRNFNRAGHSDCPGGSVTRWPKVLPLKPTNRLEGWGQITSWDLINWGNTSPSGFL